MRRLAVPRWGRQGIDQCRPTEHPKRATRSYVDGEGNVARWNRGLPNLDEQDGNGDGEK